MTIQRIDAGARMSDAVIHHQTLYYTSVAADAALDEDITGQTRSALAAVDAMLARCNTDKRRLVDATIFLPDAADFAAMNAVWDNWVEAGSAPVRCTVQAGLMNPRYKIEIQIVATLS
ncbi:RidA family protein [Candidatus Sodalis endolongispinus]|uniref:RidA family protein n=1 Tax=Candidatus Sodalis endolongispinus TaxID=2812662 RepID=A0ABS5YDK2_9GAMM|nr:RidA family protein [Candidatus Sodalis endolongispinus]MBT9433047.1 RidA family protein [Candidatus Sodalis endolongispinus]